MKGCAGNVGAGVESADADVYDSDGWIAFGVELFREISGGDGLRGGPWVGVGGWGGAGSRAADEACGGG